MLTHRAGQSVDHLRCRTRRPPCLGLPALVPSTRSEASCRWTFCPHPLDLVIRDKTGYSGSKHVPEDLKDFPIKLVFPHALGPQFETHSGRTAKSTNFSDRQRYKHELRTFLTESSAVTGE